MACVFLNVPSSPVVDHRTKTEKHPSQGGVQAASAREAFKLGQSEKSLFAFGDDRIDGPSVHGW